MQAGEIIDPLFAITARVFLGLLLLLASLHKARHFERFKASTAAFDLLPEQLTGTTATLLLAGELATGALLLTGISIQVSASSAVLILGLHFVAMAINIARGKTDVDCGCSFSRREAPLSGWHLLRNGVLIGVAIVLLLPQTQRPLQALDVTQIVSAVACLALAYLSVDSLLANRGARIREEA